MTHDDELMAQFADFFAELTRVCPEAANGLAVSGEPLPMLSLQQRIEILRALPDNAGVDAFVAAWRSFGG